MQKKKKVKKKMRNSEEKVNCSMKSLNWFVFLLNSSDFSLR